MPVPARVFLMTIDGTHCRISEPRSNPDRLHFSHKLKKPAISYEIGVDTEESKVRWISDPSKAGYSDLHIFQKDEGLKNKIPAGKRLIADNGYHGEDAIISAPNRLDNVETKEFKSRARARHETLNGRIKSHKITDSRFRSAPDKHKIIFEAVAVVVQYDMDNGMKLFDI
jgi:DDE superfamily endonuclease